MTDGNGDVATLTYDALDRVDRIDYSKPGTSQSGYVDYDYDANGKSRNGVPPL